MGRDCGWQRGEALEPRRRVQPQGCGGQSGEIPARRLGAEQHSPAREACLLSRQGGWGLGAEARASVLAASREGVREKVCSCLRGKRLFLAALFHGAQGEGIQSAA